MKYNKYCSVCHKMFITNLSCKKYCSTPCYIEHNRIVEYKKTRKRLSLKENKYCVCCGKKIDKFSSKRIFCSSECNTKFHNNNKPKTIKLKVKCKECGLEFIQKHKNNIFCCIKHSRINYYKNLPKKPIKTYNKVCIMCRTPFMCHRKNRNACSKKCADKWYRRQNKEKCYNTAKSWRKRNPEKMKLYNQTYCRKHPEYVKWHIQNHNRKWKQDPVRNVIQSLRKHNAGRCRVLKSKKLFRHDTLIGCDGKVFREYIESKFTEGMKWENYGKNGWVLDHIKRLADFDLSKPEEQLKAFNYKNLKPMWEEEHKKKTAEENKIWKRGKS